MKQGKVWGTTELIIKTESFEVHRIEVKKGGYCSTHKHEYKHNMFFVECGLLKVHVFKKDYDLEDVTELGEREKTDIKPNENHYFEAATNVVAYEIYYTEPIGVDIIRKNHGGIK